MQIKTNEKQKELKIHGSLQFPILISHECLQRYDSGSFLWHWHPEIEITFVQEGEMIYQVNGDSFHLHKGEALFGNSSTLHAGHMFDGKDCIYTSITFDSRLLYGYESSILYRKYVVPIVQDFALSAIYFDLTKEWHNDIISIIQCLIELNKYHDITYELDILILLQQFWKLLFLHHQTKTLVNEYDKRNYERIRIILSFIEVNYRNRLTLEEIAEQVHLCKEECSRIFKRYMKLSLFDFILEYRIEKSLQYLMNSDLTIRDIASNVGFNDSNYYSKVFNKVKGCPPSRYRNSI